MGPKRTVQAHRGKDGRIWARCPGCKELQEIAVGPSDYDVGEDGMLWPEFVCMNSDRSCDFAGPLWLRNWSEIKDGIRRAAD